MREIFLRELAVGEKVVQKLRFSRSPKWGAGWLELALAAVRWLPFLSLLGWPCLQVQHSAEIKCDGVPERDSFHFLKASDKKLTQTLVAADGVGELGHFRPLFEKLLRLWLSHSFAEANVLRRVVALSCVVLTRVVAPSPFFRFSRFLASS